LVVFYADNGRLVWQQRLVQLDGMVSTASTADITPSALQWPASCAADNPTVSLWQLSGRGGCVSRRGLARSCRWRAENRLPGEPHLAYTATPNLRPRPHVGETK
jgi:hypothetical protein